MTHCFETPSGRLGGAWWDFYRLYCPMCGCNLGDAQKRLQRRDVALWQFCQLSRVCFAALSFQFSCTTVYHGVWKSPRKSHLTHFLMLRAKRAQKRNFKRCDVRVLCSWMSNDIGKTFYWRKQSLVGQWRPTKSPWSNISWNEDGGVALEGCYKSLLLSKQL